MRKLLFLFVIFSVSFHLVAEPISKPRTGALLVADNDMRDPRFKHSVIFLIEYDAQGAWGVIINRPADISISEAVTSIEDIRDPVYFGGPVEMDRIIFIKSAAAGSKKIINNVYLAFDEHDIKEAYSKGEKIRAYAGYAGWGAGQLDFELKRGGWRLYRGHASYLFDHDPNTLWQELMKSFEAIQI